MARSPGSVKAGSAFVSVGGDLSPLQKSMRGVGNAFRKVGSVGGVALGAITKGVGLAVDAFGQLTRALMTNARQFAEYGDKLQKLSVRSRIGAESLSQLQFAAEQSGTNIDSLGTAMIRSQRRIGNAAATAGGPAAKALERLGLSAEKLTQMNPEQQFFTLVDALNAVEDPAVAAQQGFEIFGDNIRDLLPLIRSGSGGIREMMMRADELGATLTDDGADAAARLTDAFNEMSTATRSAWNRIAIAVEPIITTLFTRGAEKIAEFAQVVAAEIEPQIDTWVEYGRVALEAGFAVLNFFADLPQQVANAFTAFSIWLDKLKAELLGFADLFVAVWEGIENFDFESAFDRAASKNLARYEQILARERAFEQSLINQQTRQNKKSSLPLTANQSSMGEGVDDVGRDELVATATRAFFSFDRRQTGVNVNKTIADVSKAQLDIMRQMDDKLGQILSEGGLT